MEEVIIYFLILVTWHPDYPGQFEVKRFPQTFIQLEECKMYGEDSVAKHEMYPETTYGTKRAYACVKGPLGREVDEAFEKYAQSKEIAK
jgi:hypothetical protein